MDEIKVEIIPALMVPIVARQTQMDRAYVAKISDMIERGGAVLLAARRDVEGFVDNYIGRASLWLAPAEEPEVRAAAPDAALVTALEVNERARLQGVATVLMQALEDEARRRDRVEIAVGVEPNNHAARKLYESMGYTYKKLGDSDTYPASWQETDTHGAVKTVSVDAMLMMKALA